MKNTSYPRFFPLIMADDVKREAAPLFMTTSANGMERYTFYLSENSPRSYRLNGKEGLHSITVHCPYCNKGLKPISQNSLAPLYYCEQCNHDMKLNGGK